MNEDVLLIAFIAFVIVLLTAAFLLRKMTVQDIFDDKPSPVPSFSSRNLTSFDPQKTTLRKANTTVEKSFKFDREGINKMGKIIGVIGTIMLFAPLPSSLDTLSLGLAFFGYLVAKMTTPPKSKTSTTNTQNPTAQKIRQLAGKPEYQEAMKILQTDYSNQALVTDEDKYKRALDYLQSKGIPFKEAQENLRLLFLLLNRQRKNN